MGTQQLAGLRFPSTSYSHVYTYSFCAPSDCGIKSLNVFCHPVIFILITVLWLFIFIPHSCRAVLFLLDNITIFNSLGIIFVVFL